MQRLWVRIDLGSSGAYGGQRREVKRQFANGGGRKFLLDRVLGKLQSAFQFQLNQHR
jgi:hypothetical protein